MKNFLFIALTIFFCFNNNLFSQTQNDTLSIEQAVLNYLEALDNNDPLKLEKAMHPELAKRVIKRDKNGNCALDNMGYSLLSFYTKTFDYTRLYKEDVDAKTPLKVETLIFDISNDIATVKATQNKFAFIDYLHLGKMNEEWKIINILWAWID